jgi:hypothetical protein
MKYILEVTSEQLKELQTAVEVLARLRVGQIGSALDQMLNSRGQSHIIDWNSIRRIEEIIKPQLNLEINASYGVGHFEKADLVWDMFEVIRHRLSWDTVEEEGEPVFRGVSFDQPMHWLKSVPLMKIERKF